MTTIQVPQRITNSAMRQPYRGTELRAPARAGAQDANQVPSVIAGQRICLGCGRRQEPDGSLPCGH